MFLLFNIDTTVYSNTPNVPNLPRWFYRGRPKTRPVVV